MLISSSEKICIFPLADKNECAAEMKIRNLNAVHCTSCPDGSSIIGLPYKKSKTSWQLLSIGRNRTSFCVTKAVQYCEKVMQTIIAQYRSSFLRYINDILAIYHTCARDALSGFIVPAIYRYRDTLQLRTMPTKIYA